MDFSKFDAMVDAEALAQEINTVNLNGEVKYEKVPYGTYEVSVKKMVLGESKTSGNPKVEIWFEILEGDYKGQMLFMHQVVTKPFQFHIVNRLTEAMIDKKANYDPKTGYCGYAQTLEELSEEVMEHEYAMEYGERKGFDTFKIVAVLD